MLHVALVMVLVAEAAGVGSPRVRPRASRGRQIVLDEANAGRPHEIDSARGVLTTVEFPEEMTAPPECKDCTDASNPGDGLFVLQAGKFSRYLTIWPSNSARRWAAAGEKVLVPVQVRLAHAEVTLVVRRVEPKRADRRVVFVGPDRTAENEYLRVEREKLQAAVAQQIEEGVLKRFQQAFREPHRCERSRGSARKDGIVLEVNEICYFGDQVVIVFTVENRARTAFESGSLMVNKGTKVKEYPLGAPIEFQEQRTGVVVAKLPSGVPSQGRYELTLHEGGGKGRIVTIRGIEI